MGMFDFRKFIIYRWRYIIGYSLVAIGLIAVLIFAGMYLPGGLSNQEIQSVIKSNSLNGADFWSINAINLPYYLLQKICLVLFGVSVLSIKLPSIILALLSAVGMVLLLRQWFKPRIAVLASLIAITTGQFLFISQNGTPDVLYLFWSVWIILIASLIPLQTKFRKLFIIAFFTLAALSLYTPLSIYVILVIAGSIALHPHLRYLIKQLSIWELVIGLIIILILISPLMSTVIHNPDLGLSLLGVPVKWPNIGDNIALINNQFYGFASTEATTVITPFFELGSSLLIALGAYFVIKTRTTAKNYVVMLWILCLIPVIILNPDLTSITFLPLVILLGSGLSGLLAHWYSLFPHNPYARIGGLIPLIFLVTLLVLSGVNRYIYSYRYNPKIVPNFSNDLRLIPKETKNIIVSDDEMPFYSVINKYNKKINVSTEPTSDEFVATRESKREFNGYAIDKIITTNTFNNSDRFYVYKKITE